MKKKPKEVKEEVQQLDLGIKEPFKNKIYKLKGHLDMFLLRFEVRKFLKDPIVWASLTISIILILHQAYLVYMNIDSLPRLLPIFRYFLSIPKKLVDKEYIILFPSISILSFILVFFFTSRHYNNEKLLTKFLLFSLILCCISQTIILIDLVKFF